MVKKKACVFISGSGTNLKALINNSRNYNFPINISYIVSNTKKAKGLKYGKLYGIPCDIIHLNNKLKLVITNNRDFVDVVPFFLIEVVRAILWQIAPASRGRARRPEIRRLDRAAGARAGRRANDLAKYFQDWLER